MAGENIKTCKIYSDALETTLFEELEELLTGSKYDAASIKGLTLNSKVSTRAIEFLYLIASSVE